MDGTRTRPVGIDDVGTVALEELPCACFLVTRDGLIRTANARAGRFLSCDLDALVGRRVVDLYADRPEGRQRAVALHERFLSGLPIDGEVLAFATTDGRTVWGQLWVQPVVDGVGRTVESRSLVFDVTAQQQAELERQRSERRFLAAFVDAPTGTAILAEDGRILAANAALADLLGNDEESLEGRSLEVILAADTGADARATLPAPDAATSGEYPLPDPWGETRWVRVTIARIGNDTEDEAQLIAHIEDVTAARHGREQLQRAAARDPLTGVLNRRGFLERGAEILAAADRHERSVAVLFLDVDGLKEVNDRSGHAAGDRLLCDVAEALQQRFRTDDQVARWGGDEFCVLLSDVDEPAIEKIVAELRGNGAGASPLARVSIGHAVRSPGRPRELGELVDEADHAMYAHRGLA
ncbi:MAG: diguanylate cyclase [Nitriliruptoraceae bacterium]